MAQAIDSAALMPERFRSYLRMLAELELGHSGRAKIDPSDIVQQTLLDAHRDRGQFRGKAKPRWQPGSVVFWPATWLMPCG